MLHDLDVPYLDAAASQLVWELGAAPQPPVASARVELGGGHWLDVRLLGASHQVLVRDRAGGVACSELVACRPGTPGSLPPAARHHDGDVDYGFRSFVRRVDAPTLAGLATELRRRAEGPAVLAATFPGSPDALTAVAITATGWNTWHLYPQSGEVVETVTTLGLAP